MKSLKLVMLSVCLVAAFAATGCGGGSDRQVSTMPTPTPTPMSSAVEFTDWSKTTVFPGMEDGTPVNMDSLTFNFDSDDNPSAYSDLLPAS